MPSRGRPRSFDRDAALRQAMLLFWERGYECTSMADLTATMRIGSPSLYAAFGSKEALFREAVALYAATAGSLTARVLTEEPTARAAIEAMLRGNAADYLRPGRPAGCMAVLAALNCSHPSVRAFMADRRRDGRELVRRRLCRGIEDCDLPADVDVDAMAGFYHATLMSLSLLARDGATAADLTAVADGAMAAWSSYLD
ncbi:TetR/AcrR family transcriptional regulator [Amycolatopsis mongoliensis]|uniref:TetR/AcrR family transcriptional regulator n=1 Tax=Amycolatopsis mongoliensis TaxID=715475 RepID=A0A9Y2NE92_9PSEU|nr:TetR/AcrR family transcriptional regulator [Amycolatopsis sp. 4-36]WIX98453.1 TetR/AcrR family transcriptional regulator [Amycolatopsis sp. 4-36]